jgi:hypothetical protein
VTWKQAQRASSFSIHRPPRGAAGTPPGREFIAVAARPRPCGCAAVGCGNPSLLSTEKTTPTLFATVTTN